LQASECGSRLQFSRLSVEDIGGGCGEFIAVTVFSELDVQMREVVELETVLAIEIIKNKQILYKLQLLTGGASGSTGSLSFMHDPHQLIPHQPLPLSLQQLLPLLLL
jgi:hypothetical protein